MTDYKPIPLSVVKAVVKGLELRQEYGRGGTDAGIKMARQIVSAYGRTGTMPYAHVRKISQYFPRHAGDNLEQKNPPSNGWIAWLLWGGDAGWKWSKRIVERVEGK